ncbi:IQ calmodulin-binding motif family protein [Tritrichomonas foetus]|uniref:IQ calmodulin-binding motif family protein n=1 Tax=Tritrichomonas foetus TaxID=1144522 RepID=A0A1J4JGU0_9EUKA|nr:IQ calmodulin-binding motif family protein [Tritrichomonas foetus]|eukprot:OHS96460.1 IQ calmodulin-binding motif family protein [Tritrichomonas foetus]
MSTCDEIFSTFFRGYFSHKNIKEKAVRNTAAIVIQRAFRRYLFLKSRYFEQRQHAAYRIQHLWREFNRRLKWNRLYNPPKNQSLLDQLASSLISQPGPPKDRAPRNNKRKVLVNLLPPYRNKNKNKLSPRDIEEMEENQQNTLKWVTKDIMTSFMRGINNILSKRDELKELNFKHLQRVVSKSFYSIANHSNETSDLIICSFLHAPTFTIYTVTKDHISRQSIDLVLEEVEDFYINFSSHIIDADMHKLSGRIFCLLSDWKITVFENGYYSRPYKLPIERPRNPQVKYLKVDKFGYLWITFTNTQSIIYMLDPLCYSVITKFPIILPQKKIIKSFFPIYDNGKLISFFATSKSTSSFYIIRTNGEVINTFNSHSKFTPKFVVTKIHVLTYGNDKKMVLYRRIGEKLTELQSFFLHSVPISAIFIHGLKLFAVSFQDGKINFYTMGNENYSKTLPLNQVPENMRDKASEVIGNPTTTQSRLMYSIVLSMRVCSYAVSLSAIQFSEDAALIQCHLINNQVLTFWLLKQHYKLKCIHYDNVCCQPCILSIQRNARQVCESIFSELSYPIDRTRRQFFRDTQYLQQIGYEFEKRFIAARFRSKEIEEAAKILMQSPFRRWVRSLSFLEKNTISVYEIFYFTRHLIITKFKSVEEMNAYIVQHIPSFARPSVGATGEMIGTKFSLSELKTILPLFIDHCSEELKIYIKEQERCYNKPVNFVSLQFKDLICERNRHVIYRLTQIEDIVKNRMFGTTTRRNFIASLKCPKFSLKVPEIVPENAMPQFTPKWMKESKYCMPDPLVERFRYHSFRELEIDDNEIIYCSYGAESPYAKNIPLKGVLPMQEISITRPMSKMSMTFDLIAVSPDSSRYIVQYPIENVPLNYILASGPFREFQVNSIHVARYWLSQILMIIAALHKHKIVLRSLLPSNLFVSYDGVNVQVQSLADALFVKDKDDKPLPFENTPWNPPECYYQERATPAFDIFQFGVLMAYMMTGVMPNAFNEVIKYHKKMSQQEYSDILLNDNFMYDPFDNIPVDDIEVFVKKGVDLVTLIDVDSSFSMKEIVRCCLDVNPRRRPSAKQLLQHPFFNLPQFLVKRARNYASNIVRKVPVPLLVDGIFFTLFDKIKEEMEESDSYEIKQEKLSNKDNQRGNVKNYENEIYKGSKVSSLNVAVNILNYFLNPSRKQNVRLKFPIDEKMKNELVEEVLNQNIFNRMALHVVHHLQSRFEIERKIDEDMAFNDIVSLYHQFFISCLDQPAVFVKCFNSFRYLATGLKKNNDSFLLSNFLHSKMRPFVEFFFTKIPPKMQKELHVSSFYCEHFMKFYDNNRDFDEGIAEKSELRCASVLNFYLNFIDLYPCPEILKLFHDFKVFHKIDLCLCFSNHSVKLEALNLSIRLLSFKYIDRKMLDRYVSTQIPNFLTDEATPYQEKVAALEIARLILFSKSLIAISHLLMVNIVEAILFCCPPRVDRNSYSIWGQNNEVRISEIAKKLLADICQKGMSHMFKRFIFESKELFQELSQMKLISYNDFDYFEDEIAKMKNGVISDALVSILRIAESSPMVSVLSMTRSTKKVFADSLVIIAKFLMNQTMIDPELFLSLLRIWNYHKITIYQPLLERIMDDFKKRKPGSSKLIDLTFSILKDVPEYFIKTIDIWIENIKIEYNEIKQMIEKRSIIQSIVDNYAESRKRRINMLHSILTTRDSKLTVFFEHTSFLNLLFQELLPDVHKFDINMKVLPQHFAEYNRTYPIRSESILFIRDIIINRSKNAPLFYYFSQIMRLKGILERESELVMKIADPVFRKTTIKLLNVLDDRDSPFEVSKHVLKNRLLLNLKEEDLNDWDNFEILRSAFAQDSKKESIKRVRPLYDSLTS